MQVLMVDDSAAARARLGAVLRDFGCEVIEACDGQEALQLLLGGAKVDCVFLDWHMPRMDGPTMLKTIRQLGFDELKVAFVTSEHDIVRGLSSGADRYLTKPYTHNQIRNVLVQFGIYESNAKTPTKNSLL